MLQPAEFQPTQLGNPLEVVPIAPDIHEHGRAPEMRFLQLRDIMYGYVYKDGRLPRTEEKVTAETLNRHWDERKIPGEHASKRQLSELLVRSEMLAATYKEREGRDLLDEKDDRLLRAVTQYPLWQLFENQWIKEHQQHPPEEADQIFTEIRTNVIARRDGMLSRLAAEAMVQHGE